MFLPVWRMLACSSLLGGCRQPAWGAAGRCSGAGRPAGQPARASDPALGLQNGGAKVLEKTFEEWMRYRDECLRRMASEPYPAGTRLCPGSASDVGARGAGQQPGLGPGFIPPPASSTLVSYGGMSQGTDECLHISDEMPRAGMPWGAEAGVGHQGPVQGDASPLGGAGSGLGRQGWMWPCHQHLTIGFSPPRCCWKGSSATGRSTCMPAGPTGAPAPPSTSPAPSTYPGLRKVMMTLCHPRTGSQG